MVKARELHEFTDEVLVQQYEEAKDNLFKARFQHATGQLDNSALLGALKRDVARIRTIFREREIAAAEGNN